MKKIISLLIQISIFVSLFALPVNSYSSSQFIYEENDGYIVIESYTGSDTKVTIPEEIDSMPVKKIDDKAFANNELIESVDIADSVEIIGDCAFENCISLSKINLSGNLKRIGREAFLGTEYFNNTDNWTIRTIDNGTTIPWAFVLADELETIYIGDALIYAHIKGTYTINSGTRLIADAAFEGTGIEELTIPKSVEYIGADAFKNCKMLRKISIMNSVVSIESGAFEGTKIYKDRDNWQDGCLCIGDLLIDTNPDKREVDIADNISAVVGRNIFSNYVLLPESVSYIDEEAFYGDNVKAFVNENTYAERFCIEHNIARIYETDLETGDLNFDGVFNSADYAACKAMVYSSQNPGKVEIKLGDIDCDGSLDGFDAIALNLVNAGALSLITGDANGDHLIGKDDSEKLSNIIYGNGKMVDKFEFDRCDINGDGAVDGFDLICLNLMLA